MITRRCWRGSPALTAVAIVVAAVVMPLTTLALFVDSRTIVASAAWLKPLKFAFSTAVYAASIAWLMSYLPERTPSVRRAGTAVAIVLLLELGLIDLQAWRGTTSHFNVSSPLNIAVVSVMGASIGVLIAASCVVFRALIAHRFEDAAIGHLIRGSLAITIAGTFITGLLMIAPRPSQIRELRSGAAPAILGAHTVGGADGGPVLPLIGWSATHGDLRPAHFAALHALQLVPLLFWAATRRRDHGAAERLRISRAITGLYGLLVVALTVQALGGHALVPAFTAAQVFSLCTFAAASGWLLLMIAPTRHAAVEMADRVIPASLALVYTGLVLLHWTHAPGSFRTLAGVAELFSNPWLLLAGWIHYLSFDLIVGGWMVRRWRGQARLLLTACLLLTFMFGPAGLLLYLAAGRRA